MKKFYVLLITLCSLNLIAQAQTPCSEPFFSEYIEGSSNNKALEIFNPSDSDINLDGYYIYRYNNGSADASYIDTLSGTLASHGVYLIANSQADTQILTLADTTSTITFYNGDDALALFNGSDMIDVIGNIGEDPGDEWIVGSGSTKEHTLVRKATVTQGNTDWASAADEWDVYFQDDFTFLGSHSFVGCGATEPIVSFSQSNINVEEGETAVLTLLLVNNDSPVMLTFDAVNQSATNGEDYTFEQTTFLIDANISTYTLEVPTIDDDQIEGDEVLLVYILNAQGATIGTGEVQVNITDNDFDYPIMKIAEVTQENADGSAVSFDDYVELRGVVYGTNLRNAGLQFTLMDETGGINIFSANDNYGYTNVAEGDSIHIRGQISQFRGLTQLNVNQDIEWINANNTLQTAEVVTALNEDTESRLVTLACVSLTNPSEWLGDGSSYTVNVSDGNSTFALRIQANTNVSGSAAPQGNFNITGIGGQFNSSSSAPYLDGYQLSPRYVADIENIATPDALSFTFEYSYDNNSNISSVLSVNNPIENINYTWTVDGETTVEGTAIENLLTTEGVFNVCLTATNTCNTTATYCEDVSIIIEGFEKLSTILAISQDENNVWLENNLNETLYISIVNIQGQNIAQQKLGAGVQAIDITTLSPGTYFLLMQNQETWYAHKFVKW
ncbi:MAG: lamin tail domain-containing protein [Bacteroidetes bacterium]|nr:lamin tail domain-containing protein [Bacteroidota bacterium]